MRNRGSRGNYLARFAALAGLALAGVVLIGVVSASISEDEGERAEDARQQAEEAPVGGCEPEAKDAVKNGYYVVEEGDLLSLISERTCVPDDELARFNPQVDPQALTPGQCISLVEGGCEKRE